MQRWSASAGEKTLSGAAPGATHEQKGDRGSAPSGDKAMSPSGGQPAKAQKETTSYLPFRVISSTRDSDGAVRIAAIEVFESLFGHNFTTNLEAS
jgi:hypothetical protein